MVDQKAVERACIEQIGVVDGFPPDLEERKGGLGVTVKHDKLTGLDQFYYKRKIIVTVDKAGKIEKHPVTPALESPMDNSGVQEPGLVAKPDEEVEEPVKKDTVVFMADGEVDVDEAAEAAGDFPEADKPIEKLAVGGLHVVIRVGRSGTIINSNIPTVIHDGQYLAREEAKRLASKHIGSKFYVFKAIGIVEAEAKISMKAL